MTGCQTHHGDGDGCSVHIDGAPQRDAHRVEVLIEAQTLAERHVDGYVGSRRAGEEGAHGTFPEAPPQERVGVAPEQAGADEGVDHQHHHQHAAYEQEQQLAVGAENLQSALAHRSIYQSQDAQRSQLDNPLYHHRHGLSQLPCHLDGLYGSRLLERQSHDDAPEEHAQIGGRADCLHGVARQPKQKIAYHLVERSGCRCFHAIHSAERKRHGEHLRSAHSHHGSYKRAGQIEGYHHAEALAQPLACLGHRSRHQHSHQNGCNSLERSHKQLAQGG